MVFQANMSILSQAHARAQWSRDQEYAGRKYRMQECFKVTHHEHQGICLVNTFGLLRDVGHVERMAVLLLHNLPAVARQLDCPRSGPINDTCQLCALLPGRRHHLVPCDVL